MDNIFNTLIGNLPKASEEQKQQLAALEGTATAEAQAAVPLNKMPLKELVAAWQKDARPEYTSEVLKRMQPTIKSAMTSYAPGMDNKLSIKAAQLTLQALKTYSPEHGAEPSTYVFHNLKRLSRLGNRSASIMPQPEGFVMDQQRMRMAIDKFVDIKGREPSIQELADATGFSTKRLEKLMVPNMVVSESSTLSEDTLKDTRSSNMLTDNDYFEYVYSSVGPIDQMIMEWTAGKHGKKPLSNNQIAEKLHISAAAVSQRKNRIQNMMNEVRSLL